MKVNVSRSRGGFSLLVLVAVFSVALSQSQSQGVTDFSIRTFHGKQCLTAVDGSSGSRLAISDCSSSKTRAQTWMYYGYKQETPTTIFTQLRLKGSSKCLTIINGSVVLYSCMHGVRGQVWNLRHFQHVTRILVPGYRSENGTSIGCLAVAVQAAGYEQVFGNGTPLILEECDEKKNKMFLLKSAA